MQNIELFPWHEMSANVSPTLTILGYPGNALHTNIQMAKLIKFLNRFSMDADGTQTGRKRMRDKLSRSSLDKISIVNLSVYQDQLFCPYLQEVPITAVQSAHE